MTKPSWQLIVTVELVRTYTTQTTVKRVEHRGAFDEHVPFDPKVVVTEAGAMARGCAKRAIEAKP